MKTAFNALAAGSVVEMVKNELQSNLEDMPWATSVEVIELQ